MLCAWKIVVSIPALFSAILQWRQLSPAGVAADSLPTVSVVQRFGGEPQLMSNGFDVHHQIHWHALISIGHQLRVHRQNVALRFCLFKR